MCRVGKKCHIPAAMKWPSPTHRYTSRSTFIRKRDVFTRKDASAYFNIINTCSAADSGSCCYWSPRIFSMLASLMHFRKQEKLSKLMKSAVPELTQKGARLALVFCLFSGWELYPKYQNLYLISPTQTHSNILCIQLTEDLSDGKKERPPALKTDFMGQVSANKHKYYLFHSWYSGNIC